MNLVILFDNTNIQNKFQKTKQKHKKAQPISDCASNKIKLKTMNNYVLQPKKAFSTLFISSRFLHSSTPLLTAFQSTPIVSEYISLKQPSK